MILPLSKSLLASVYLTNFLQPGGAKIKKQVRPEYRKWQYTPDYYDLSQKTLETALDRVAAYRSWRSLDPGPQAPIDARFAALPALTKKDIREYFPHGILPGDRNLEQGLASGEVALVETSGTTDDKITNIWNQKWWDASERASWKLNSLMSEIATGDHREAILVNPKNVGIRSDEADLPLEKRRLARFLYLNEKSDPLAWTTDLLDRMVNELNTFQPAVLEANPSYLARLCRYIAASGKAVFQPRAIVFTYEYPTHFHYRQVQKVFPGTITISSYGTTETGYVFMQCEKGKLHQNCEYSRVDFQPFKREQGGPLMGRMLVTPLRNPWSYILRFDTGDIVQLEESGKCECGRITGLILSAVAGRKANLTLTTGGRLVTLYELDNKISRLEGVEEYQLVQTGPGEYELYLVSLHSANTGLNKEAAELLKQIYGSDARIKIIFKNDIAPEDSGKYLVSRALFPIELEKYLE